MWQKKVVMHDDAAMVDGLLSDWVDLRQYLRASVTVEWTATSYSAKTFGVDDVFPTGNEFFIASHGLLDDMSVQVTTDGTLPGGVAALTTYYVVVIDADRIQLFDSVGGSAIDVTSIGTGTHTITPVATAPTFTPGAIAVAADEIFIEAHGLVEDQPVTLTTTGTLPAGFSLATPYYVIRTDADRFQLEASLGGGAVNITDIGSGTHTVVPTATAPTFGPDDVAPVGDEIYIAAHGYVTDLPVQISTDDTLPTGLSAVTTYYVIVNDVNRISLSATPAGAAIDITGRGVGNHTITPDAYNENFTDPNVGPTGNEFYISAHGWVDDLPVDATTDGTLPDPLTATTYYVIVNDADHVSLAATPGGAAIDLTDRGSGTTTLTPVAAAPTFGPEDVAPVGDEFYEVAHEMVDGLPVQLTTTDTLPAPLQLATTYYILKNDANRFGLEASVGGGVIDITDHGVGTHTVTPVTYAPTFETTDVDTGNNTIYVNGHSFVENEEVQFTTSNTLPAGLSLATDYYVLVQDADRIKVEASVGGGAVDITDVGTGTHTATRNAAAPTPTAAETFPAANSMYMASHGLVDAEEVQFTTATTLPAGLSLATPYYVIVVDADTIQVEATAPGNGVVNITDAGTGTHTATRQASAGAGGADDCFPVANSIYNASHTFVDGELVALTTDGTEPGGLSTATPYYIVYIDANSFSLSLTSGGAAVDITDGGSGTHNLARDSATASGIAATSVFPTANSIYLPSHALLTNEPITLTTDGVLPAGTALVTTYYVNKVDADSITLLDGPGGSGINITDEGSGTTHTATLTATTLDMEFVHPVADTFYVPSHGFADEEPVQFTTDGALPTGISAVTDYYIIYVDADSFQIEASVDGGATNITADGSGTHTATRQTSAETCAAENVGVAAENIYIATHGYVDNLVVQLTTTGTLPTGLSLSTDYWVIVVDANTIRLSASQDGAAVNITADGSGTHTATPTALAGTHTLEWTNDSTNGPAITLTGSGVVPSSESVSSSGSMSYKIPDMAFGYLRSRYAETTGNGTLRVVLQANGE